MRKVFTNKLLGTFMCLNTGLVLTAIFGYFSVRTATKQTGEAAKRFITFYGVGVFIFAILFIAIASTIVTKLMRQIKANLALMSEAAEKLAQGSATEEIEKISDDEFGDLIDKFNIMIKTTKEEAEIAEAVSEGDLTIDVKPKSKEDILGNSLKRLVTENNHALSNISDSAVQVMTSASEVASASEALAQGSTEQASAIEEITASIDDVADKTKNNAAKAEDAAELMMNALKNMEKSNESMKEMVDAISFNQQSTE